MLTFKKSCILHIGPGIFEGQIHPGKSPFNHDKEDETGARDFMLKNEDHPGYIQSDQLKERRDLDIDSVTPDDLDKLYSHNSEMNPHINPRFHQVRTNYDTDLKFVINSRPLLIQF